MVHSAIFKGALFKLFAVTILVLLVLVAVISKMRDLENAKGEKPTGNMSVSIAWPEGDTDIDLWVFGPNEIKPVGYSNKGGMVWNLVRDDIGDRVDKSMGNFETSFTRGLFPGDYIFNVQCYRCPIVPILVQMEVRITDLRNQETTIPVSQTVWKGQIELKVEGQEKTGVFFTMKDDKGTIDPDSIDHVLRPLRSGAK